MEIKLLDEPLLQFGKGEYVCPRTGIYKYNVSDINDSSFASTQIM